MDRGETGRRKEGKEREGKKRPPANKQVIQGSIGAPGPPTPATKKTMWDCLGGRRKKVGAESRLRGKGPTTPTPTPTPTQADLKEKVKALQVVAQER